MYYENANSKTTKKVPVISPQVPQTVNPDDDDDDKIVNEAVPTLNSEEREVMIQKAHILEVLLLKRVTTMNG